MLTIISKFSLNFVIIGKTIFVLLNILSAAVKSYYLVNIKPDSNFALFMIIWSPTLARYRIQLFFQ